MRSVMKKNRIGLISTYLTLMFLTPSLAQSDNETFLTREQSLGLISHLYIYIDDQVEGGCWTNSSAIEASLRLKFEREDIPVLREPPAFFSPTTMQVIISAIGLRSRSGLCATHASFEVGRPISYYWGGADGRKKYWFSGYISAFQRTAIFVSGDTNNEQISELMNEATDNPLADILSMRRSDATQTFFQNYPDMRDTPMTKEEFEKLIKLPND